MKVALIHDHLAQDGGAEKVLKSLADIYPDAPIYTLLYEDKQVNKYFKNRTVLTSIIQRLPGGVKHYQWYLPFMPMAVEFFDLTDYDVVISDASAFAKGVITKPETLHICYCHTPTRYLWSDTHSYIAELKYNKYFKKIISFVLNYIRLWDKQAADRVDKFIANSRAVEKRIKKYYRRNSTVIYPPVETCKAKIADKIDDNFLIGGRVVYYKRFDLVIEAFLKMPERKLKIFGDGVDLDRLKNIANGAKNIEFLGRVSEEEKFDLFSRAKAFINPQVEDFGITMAESLATGRPVIALAKDGALEIVDHGKTGILFKNQNAEDIVRAVNEFENYTWDSNYIRSRAMEFSEEKFKENIKKFVEEEYNKFVNL